MGTIDHEAALLRARRRYPPEGIDRADADRAYDTAFLLMSAHEFLAIGVRSSRPSPARLVRRDGSSSSSTSAISRTGSRSVRELDHFQSRSTWLHAAAAAGFVPTNEARLTPYVRGFVFERAQP